jgi:hypothetical protein
MGFLIVALLAAGWLLARSSAGEERERCERSVAGREDNRAMWIYLVEQNPGVEADAFMIELERRLPRLKCVNGTPTPIQIGVTE